MKSCSEYAFRRREEWTSALRELLGPVLPYLAPERAGLFPGGTGAFYGLDGSRIEAFVRVLTGAAILARSTGELPEQEDILKTLRNGTNPEHPAYWRTPRDRDQRIVEMAGLALALGTAPDHLWHPLDDTTKRRVADWLASTNRAEPVANNWILFRLLTNAVLHRLGRPPREDPSEQDWEKIDAQYLGDGWYSDGEGSRQRDYYVPKGFHLFSLYVRWLHPALPQERAGRILERALTMAPDMAAFQSDEGLLLPFGRSLTYRFAPLAYWGALALAGAECRGFRERMARALRWWFRQPILDSGGILTIGFRYPNLNMTENYNAPGGPYFCMHAFLPLVLEDNHAFWTEPDAHPARRDIVATPAVHALPHARMVVVRDPQSAHHWAFGSGQRAEWPLRHHAEKYAKFAYSSRHGFCVSGGIDGLNRVGIDNALAISEDDQHWMLCEPQQGSVENNTVSSVWTKPGWIRVEITLRLDGHDLIREFDLQVERELLVVEGGWSVPYDTPDAAAEGRQEISRRGLAAVSRGPQWHSSIRDQGSPSLREGFLLFLEPNLNVMYPLVVIPCLREKLSIGRHHRTTRVRGYGAPDPS